jgi:hypothetical protein
MEPRDSTGGVNGKVDSTLGAAGASCYTACDCNPGLACINGKCNSAGVPRYCCESTSSCPSGMACQRQSGPLGICGGGTGNPDMATSQPLDFSVTPPTDGGGGGNPLCLLVQCTTNADCPPPFFGCAGCNTTLGICM